ncbi:MAG: UMP kinase [Nitrososphaerales archaeon]|nr:UMP kinase [Nitrososphaerales archaeon]
MAIPRVSEQESPIRVVIKLSGSLFKWGMKASDLEGIVELCKELKAKGVQPILVAGGGEIARHYISLGRSLGADETSLDEMGIAVARLNASLLISSLKGLSYPTVPKNLDEVVQSVESGKIVAVGGLHPGHSTNATAALIAERVGAKLFINATDVDGVYTSDPRTDKDAKLLKKVTIKELMKILLEGKMNAGTYELMDLVALKIIERSKIPTRIIKYSTLNLIRVIEGEDLGTIVEV